MKIKKYFKVLILYKIKYNLLIRNFNNISLLFLDKDFK